MSKTLAAAVRASFPICPISIPLTGKKHEITYWLLGLVAHLPILSFKSRYGIVQVDPSHKPERFLPYIFEHHLAHFRRSDLGRYIAKMKPGTVFVDVGANLGMYSLLARAAGMAVILYEPEPKHSAFLTRNPAIFGNLIRPVALSNDRGSLPFYMETKNSGGASLRVTPNAKLVASVPVETFSEEIKESVDLVKIDVEGAEAETVLGMTRYLEDGHRPVIWCEVRGSISDRAPDSYKRVIETLKPFGYLAFESDGSFFDERDGEGRSVFDLIFKPFS